MRSQRSSERPAWARRPARDNTPRPSSGREARSRPVRRCSTRPERWGRAPPPRRRLLSLAAQPGNIAAGSVSGVSSRRRVASAIRRSSAGCRRSPSRARGSSWRGDRWNRRADAGASTQLELPAPGRGGRPLRVVLLGPGKFLAFLGDGVADDEQIHGAIIKGRPDAGLSGDFVARKRRKRDGESAGRCAALRDARGEPALLRASTTPRGRLRRWVRSVLRPPVACARTAPPWGGGSRSRR